MPKRNRRRRRRLITFLTISTVIAGVGLISHHSKKLTSPDRRPLQDYHQEIFGSPEQHGISIERHACLDGKVPCLIVLPDPESTLGRRGEIIRGQVESPLLPHGEIIANLVLLHGRNGRKEDLLPIAERFCAVGFCCILPDLPAHGDSPVQTSHFGLRDWERQLPKTVLDECARQFDFPDRPSALWGISMGGSFATHAASAGGDRWDCLVIVSSFDSLESVIRNQCRLPPIAGLVSAACRLHGGPVIHEVRPKDWARSAELPVLVAHGSEDQLIDLDSGRTLFESFPSAQKRWIEVEGGTHQNVLTTRMPLFAKMADWFLLHTTSVSAASRAAE